LVRHPSLKNPRRHYGGRASVVKEGSTLPTAAASPGEQQQQQQKRQQQQQHYSQYKNPALYNLQDVGWQCMWNFCPIWNVPV